MANPFIAEIRIFAGNFAPNGWAFCNGQLFPISQNTALFSLLGTTYGGNGTTNFALPDLRGCSPMHQGQGPGLTNRTLGEQGGEETVTLNVGQLPAHSHPLTASTGASTNTPTNSVLGQSAAKIYGPPGNLVPMAGVAVLPTPTGNSLPHDNRQPYLALNFIIALQGIFPPRS
jgi:microcystin-dependent protein